MKRAPRLKKEHIKTRCELLLTPGLRRNAGRKTIKLHNLELF